MVRTFIFDSGDPNSTSFVDEAAVTSDDGLDDDFLSFEDDLDTGSSSSSSDDSTSSGNSRLSRLRSRTGGASDDEESDDGRSQRLVRAISRVVMSGSASIVSRHRHKHTSSDGSDDEEKKKRRKRKYRKRQEHSSLPPEILVRQPTLEDVREDDNTSESPVNVISSHTPGPEGLMNAQPHQGKVTINLPDQHESIKMEDINLGAPSDKAANGKPTGGIGFRKLLSKKPPFEKKLPSLQRSNSTKKTRRRYSGSMGSAAAAQRRAGWEPGVDTRTTDIILESIGSAVTIVDYSVERYRIVQTEVHPAPKTDEDLIDPSLTVNKEFHHHLNTRPSWSQVRWISVNGLSWEAISAISTRYQLHRLAIEDMVDIPQRTKVDLYPSHTFCCLPLHKLVAYKPESKQEVGFWDWVLGREKEERKKKSSNKLSPLKSNVSTASKSSKSSKSSKKKASKEIKRVSPPAVLTGQPMLPADSGLRRPIPPLNSRKTITLPDSSSSSSSSEDEDDHKPLNAILAAKGMETMYDWNNPYAAIQQKSSYIESKRPLSVYKRAVGVEQVSLFLTSQDTVISFFERSAADIERPLLARLSTQSTILRESCDPSLLLQAIVDAIVDLIQPVIAAYRRRFDDLEFDAMLNPSMGHTQDLHLMAGELSMLRNTIVPLTSLVLSLRDHTSAAQSADYHVGGTQSTDYHDHSSSAPPSPPLAPPHSVNDHRNSISMPTPKHSHHPASLPLTSSPPPPETLGGVRVSALAKVYLADISDHLLSHTQDLDVMRNNTKNMIDLVFNTISIQSSDSVKQLSIITVIFLPLSFWTGYFGMNFDKFGALDHTVAYYWTVSIPFSLGVLFLAMAGTIVTGLRRLKIYIKKKKRSRERRAKKRLRKAARKKELSHA